MQTYLDLLPIEIRQRVYLTASLPGPCSDTCCYDIRFPMHWFNHVSGRCIVEDRKDAFDPHRRVVSRHQFVRRYTDERRYRPPMDHDKIILISDLLREAIDLRHTRLLPTD